MHTNVLNSAQGRQVGARQSRTVLESTLSALAAAETHPDRRWKTLLPGAEDSVSRSCALRERTGARPANEPRRRAGTLISRTLGSARRASRRSQAAWGRRDASGPRRPPEALARSCNASHGRQRGALGLLHRPDSNAPLTWLRVAAGTEAGATRCQSGRNRQSERSHLQIG